MILDLPLLDPLDGGEYGLQTSGFPDLNIDCSSLNLSKVELLCALPYNVPIKKRASY